MNKKLIPLVLGAGVILSGCFWQKEEEPPPPPPPPPVDMDVSIKDIKMKYAESDLHQFMPIYNVPQDKEFEFNFRSYLGDLNLNEVLSVHTDIEAEASSAIDVRLAPESYNIGPTTLKLSPLRGVLSSEPDEWGKAPTYYIRINYDMDADNPTRLDDPIVIPFTVKNTAPTPDLTITANENGNARLEWKEVEGATEYRVYNMTSPILTPTQEGVNSRQRGFKDLHPYLVGTVKETTFSDWGRNGRNGLLRGDDDHFISQNNNLQGDYYITAVVNGVESQASNIISTSDVASMIPQETLLPLKGERHELPRSLPKEVQVKTPAKTAMDFPVTYITDEVEIVEDQPTIIPFKVEGTVFKGDITVENITPYDLEGLGTSRDFENQEYLIPTLPDNRTPYIPDASVPMVIQTVDYSILEEVVRPITGVILGAYAVELKDGKESSEPIETPSTEESTEETTEEVLEESESTEEVTEEVNSTEEESAEEESAEEESTSFSGELKTVAHQKLNTRATVMHHNNDTIVYPAFFRTHNVKVNADSAVEEYLAISLINGDMPISLKAFPRYNTYESVTDLMNKVLMQNPLIVGVEGWRYDYEEQAVFINYVLEDTERRSLQLEMLDAANSIVMQLMTKETPKDTRIELLYSYLNENTVLIEKEPENEENQSESEEIADSEGEETAENTNQEDDNSSTNESSNQDNPNAVESEEVVAEQESNTEDDSTLTQTTKHLGVLRDTAHGVLVNGSGSSLGYAHAFKLLANQSGVDSVVITGEYVGQPHVWNKVKSGDSWLNLDASRNDTNTGLPYMNYLTSDQIIGFSNYTFNQGYWFRSDLDSLVASSQASDYYVRNNLLVGSIDEYSTKLAQELQSGSTRIIFRSQIRLDNQSLHDATGRALQAYASDKLGTATFKTIGNYLIVITEPPVEEEEDLGVELGEDSESILEGVSDGFDSDQEDDNE